MGNLLSCSLHKCISSVCIGMHSAARAIVVQTACVVRAQMLVQLYHCAKAMLAAAVHRFVMLDVGCFLLF